MRRWVRYSVTTSTTADVSTAGLSSTAEKHRRIVAVIPEVTAAFVCAIWIEQDKVFEFDSNMRTAAAEPIAVDIDIPLAANVAIGWLKAGSATAKIINVCYEEE